eukprot:CAMPEP_0202731330 /NCGR_PEP_ID=MMETSP1385-20130828/187096_1 /ASSEMBLY_ACC=CAM_ASM_000861 /TAXON_ID=933848 /ORGANISM="Elphidium margaritaceum" /LENGTH=478 /DNA_ID=CAMNT_0049397625 /DNA_START=28 /DNA_END=1461 /DNA_ORIENTATION=+
MPELIDFNIKIEDAYQNFWKNDMRTVVRFAKRFIELLKWITTEEHRQLIVLNFAYYDFALIQKIYTRFYHTESIVKRMQIAMAVIEIFQITPTLSSLNDAQCIHLHKIQSGIYRTWMAFWSDEQSIKFFNISSADLSAAALAVCSPHGSATAHDVVVDTIDDLLLESKEENATDDHNNEPDLPDNDTNSIFTIDENYCHDSNHNHHHHRSSSKEEAEAADDDDDDDDEDIADQPLKVDSFVPSNERSGTPMIRTINIADELHDINKQLTFIGDIIAWLKQQIARIKPKLSQSTPLKSIDAHTFNAIIVCLRRLLLDASAICSICVSTMDDDDDGGDDARKKEVSHAQAQHQNVSSYLRLIIEIARDLTDECCRYECHKIECFQLFKSVLADVAAHALTHRTVQRLLEVFLDRISTHQYRLDVLCRHPPTSASSSSTAAAEDRDRENRKAQIMNGKYIFHVRVLNCDYFIDHQTYGVDV